MMLKSYDFNTFTGNFRRFWLHNVCKLEALNEMIILPPCGDYRDFWLKKLAARELVCQQAIGLSWKQFPIIWEWQIILRSELYDMVWIISERGYDKEKAAQNSKKKWNSYHERGLWGVVTHTDKQFRFNLQPTSSTAQSKSRDSLSTKIKQFLALSMRGPV